MNKPPKYYANIRTPRGTTFERPLEGNNKTKLKHQIRRRAAEFRLYKTAICWFVWRTSDDRIVAHGVITEHGNDEQQYALVGTTCHPY